MQFCSHNNHQDIVLAAISFYEVATEYGLTLSVLKTKLLVAGFGLTNDDFAASELGGGEVEVVKWFKYVFGILDGRM